MKPGIFMKVTPDQDSDRAEVVMSVSCVDDNGDEHWIRLYEEHHIVMPITETMGVELWALAAYLENAGHVAAGLEKLVGTGQTTLMKDVHIVKKD